MPATGERVTAAEIEAIKTLLAGSAKARERAILVLYDRQTCEEQAIGANVTHNGEGFTSYDAELLSSFALQIQTNRWGKARGFILSERQHEVAIKRLAKYARQLAIVARERRATLAEVLEPAETLMEIVSRQTVQAALTPLVNALMDDATCERLAREVDAERPAARPAPPVQVGLFCPACDGSRREEVQMACEWVEIGCRRCG